METQTFATDYITLPYISSEHYIWLIHNVGQRTHYLRTSIGGIGWRVTFNLGTWELRFTNPAHLVWFKLMFA